MHLIPQSAAHLHILINHFPSIGLVIGLSFYVAAFIIRSDDLKRASLVLFVILGILVIPTYISGTATMWQLAEYPEVLPESIEVHRDWALLTFIGLGGTGAAAWLTIWQARHAGRLSNAGLYAVLGLAVISLALITETGHLGGQIRHPEMLPELLAAEAEPYRGVTAWIEEQVDNVNILVSWETVHFLGMGLVFGTVLIVALRVLGFLKVLSFATVHRLLPLGFLGLMMNALSGILLFLGDTQRYVDMPGFPPKMALLVIGAVAVLYFSLFERVWNVKAGEDTPLFAKAVAVVTLVSWTGVIVLGRLLPYYS